MTITKRKEHSVEVIPPYVVHCHVVEIAEEDGVEIGRNHRRYGLHPGTLDENDALVDTDLSGEDADVAAIATAAWTDAVKEAWRLKLVADKQS